MKNAIIAMMAIAVSSATAAIVERPQALATPSLGVSKTIVPVSDSYSVKIPNPKPESFLDTIRVNDGTCQSATCQACANFCGQNGYGGYCCDAEDDPASGEAYCCCGSQGGSCSGSCKVNECNAEAVAPVAERAPVVNASKTLATPSVGVSKSIVPVSDSYSVKIPNPKTESFLDAIRVNDGTCSSGACTQCANFCGQNGYSGYCCDGQDDPTSGQAYCCCGNGGSCTGSCKVNECSAEVAAPVAERAPVANVFDGCASGSACNGASCTSGINGVTYCCADGSCSISVINGQCTCG